MKVTYYQDGQEVKDLEILDTKKPLIVKVLVPKVSVLDSMAYYVPENLQQEIKEGIYSKNELHETNYNLSLLLKIGKLSVYSPLKSFHLYNTFVECGCNSRKDCPKCEQNHEEYYKAEEFIMNRNLDKYNFLKYEFELNDNA